MGETPRQDNSEPEGTIILEADTDFGPEGLPNDLQNAIVPLYMAIDAYGAGFFGDGKEGKEMMQKLLREVRSFNEYYSDFVGRRNASLKAESLKNNAPYDLYDVPASIAVQREAIHNSDVISLFDTKIMELRACADVDEKTDLDAVEIKKILEAIKKMISGKQPKPKSPRFVNPSSFK